MGYLKKKLEKDPSLKKRYSEFIEDLVERGYARKVPNDIPGTEDGKVWYLSHHNVVHPKNPDKVRVVFDCAAKYHGVSLNDNVLQGSDLANNLIGVLCRFRQYPVALMADIEAMFHQVRVNLEDVNALRFLWWPNGDLSLQLVDYQMLVHLFGGVWSPSCSNFALKKTAEDNANDFNDEVVFTVKGIFMLMIS